MKTFFFVKQKHTKKTLTFVKACLAYNHITIPSLLDIFEKLQLSLQCSEIALMNGCLPQTDTFLKSAISLIPDLSSTYEIDGKRMSNDEKLYEYFNSLLSFLIITPGHPEYGPFYIIKGLMNAMKKYPWGGISAAGGAGGAGNNASSGQTVSTTTTATEGISYYQMKVLLSVLSYLTIMCQKKLPYHFLNIQSNDDLYGNNEEYMKECYDLITNIFQEILNNLMKLGEKTNEISENTFISNKVNQIKLSLDFINLLSSSMTFLPVKDYQENITFLLKLMDLCQKHKSLLTKQDLTYVMTTNEYLNKKTNEWNGNKVTVGKTGGKKQ
jgi:hypothetical protein